MTSQTKKAKINTKLIAGIVIIIIIVASAAVVAQYILPPPQQKSSELPDMTLTLIGSAGQQQNLTKQDILALEPYSAKGGMKVHGNTISGVGTYTGVPVTTLLELVGGITNGETVTATASDGYTMTYSYDAVVNGQGFTTYDTSGSEKAATQPLKLTLTYSIDGAALPIDEGPLRMGILGSEGLITTGNQWEKMVIQLTVNPAAASPSSTPSPTAKPTTSSTTAASTAPTASPTPTPTPPVIPATQVTIIGADGTTTVVLNATGLAALPQTSGLGGKFKTQSGTFDYGTYTGVSMTTLLDLVGGISSSQVLCVTAADTWAKNYTYAQITGTGLTMFDPATNATATPTQPVTMILAYYLDGTSANLPTYDGSYLITAFVGSDGLSTTANLYSKYVIELRVYNQ